MTSNIKYYENEDCTGDFEYMNYALYTSSDTFE